MIKAIQTEYRDYRFRSRLEAKWAYFFDLMGIWWDYEPEGFALDGNRKYLPDFIVGENQLIVEIKPYIIPSDEEMAKCRLLSARAPVLLICGDPLQHKSMLFVGGRKEKSLSRLQPSQWKRASFSQSMKEIDFIDNDAHCPYLENARAARKIRFDHGETPTKPKEARSSRTLSNEEVFIRGMENIKALREMLKG